MVESYLKAPVALKPFSTIEVFIADHRRPRRHRRQFRGRLGRHRRDRRAGGRGADGRQRRHRALCLHQPGAADQVSRQELTNKLSQEAAASRLFSTRKQNGRCVHVYRNPFRLRAVAAGRTAGAGGAVDGPCQIQLCRRQQRSRPGAGRRPDRGGQCRAQARGQDARDLRPRQRPAGLSPPARIPRRKAQARRRHRLHRRRHHDRLRLAAGARPRQSARCWRAAIP